MCSAMCYRCCCFWELHVCLVGLLLAIVGCLVEAPNSVFIFVRLRVFNMLLYKCISFSLHWYYNDVYDRASAGSEFVQGIVMCLWCILEEMRNATLYTFHNTDLETSNLWH